MSQTSNCPTLIQVALPVPLYRVFDYLPAASMQHTDHLDLPPIGSRVQVPFGRQTLVGIVLAYVDAKDSEVPAGKLKPIKTAIDSVAILSASMLSFARWLAAYYHYPLGDVLAVMLPTLVRQGKSLDLLITHWRILPHVTDADFHPNAHRQKQQFNMLKLHGEQGASEEILLLEGMNRQFLKKLEQKSLIESFQKPQAVSKPASLAKMPLDLNDEQQSAVDTIRDCLSRQQYGGFLISGVTGSGKTEVYLQVIHSALNMQQQVLVLVPEIGLTPQTKARFAQRFAAHILLLHSGLSDTDRLRGWQDCRKGHAQIIIGTRSAVLYPYANLGLIVVDEAHDLSYKQQDTLRYHAGDVALYRGHELGIPVILGTATPSLEHLKLVNDGKLTQLNLTRRAGQAKPATFVLVDARHSQMVHVKQTVDDARGSPSSMQPNTTSDDGGDAKQPTLDLAVNSKSSDALESLELTQSTITKIKATLEAGKQVLIFLNRRGYAPILLCAACGWQADCPRCDAHLTLHHHTGYAGTMKQLQCHHCGWLASVPESCPECSSRNLDAIGMGTTRLTQNLKAIFANPQTSDVVYPIIQIDKDTTRRKGSWSRLYTQINKGEPAILVGTQMVAKGHHFPNVTLVCLPNADYGFLSADFRSPEHTAQLIVQVAGRAGRGRQAGEVLIQTKQPDNPLLVTLVTKGYLIFAKQLLSERQTLGLPPFSHAALIRCEGKTLDNTHAALQSALTHLPAHKLAILGPIDAPMSKKNSRYQSQLLLLAKDRSHLHRILDGWWQHIIHLPENKYLKLTLDIDPVGW